MAVSNAALPKPMMATRLPSKISPVGGRVSYMRPPALRKPSMPGDVGTSIPAAMTTTPHTQDDDVLWV
jgi:hypothetical protein